MRVDMESHGMGAWLCHAGVPGGGGTPDVADGKAGDDGEAGGAKAVEGVVRALLVVADPHVHDRQCRLAPPRPQQVVHILQHQQAG